MKKKLVAIISVVAMLVTMFPATVWAEAPSGAVEMTPEEFWALDVDGNDRIELEADIHLTKSLKINDPNKNLTIDLNDHTLSAAESTIIINGGSLNVVGPGKVVETNPNFAPILIYGSTDTDIDEHSVVSVGKDVYLEGWSGIFVDNNNGKACGVKVNFDGKINSVLDTLDRAGHGIYINGNVKDTTKNYPIVNIGEGSVINSLGTGIYAAGYGKWTINGTINGTECGLGIKAGKFTIDENARISATAEPSDPEGWGNGINGIGAAIQLESNDGYAGQIEMDINGGEIVSENSVAICEYNGNDNGKPLDEKKVISVIIKDGTIKSGEGMPAIKTRMEEDKSLCFLKTDGGSYSAPINRIYCAVGNAPIVDSTGNCHIIAEADIPTSAVEDENGCFYEGNDAIAKHNEATVNSGGNITVYPTIEKAIEAAKDGDKIMLMRNAKVEKKIEIRNSITLDLNKKEITASDSFAPTTGDNSHLIEILKGGVAIENGTVKTTENNKHGIHVYKVKNVKLEDVTIDHSNTNGGAPIVVNGSEVTLAGNITLKTGSNSWYGINVDPKGQSTAEVKFSENATLKLEGTTESGNNECILIENTKPNNKASVSFAENVTIDIPQDFTAIVVKDGDTSNVTVKNPENAGLEYDAETGKSKPIAKPSTPTGGKPSTPSVTKSRVAGDDRFETAIKVADKLKSELGVVKFNNIVVANSDEFADALSATALAADKDAPILVVNKNNESTVKNYIANNLNKGGNVYIIGGTAVVSESFEKSLTDCKVTRLGGSDRYETNLEVLKTLGVTGASDIMVASGLKYPDALSASATGNPVILVGKTLTDNQKAYLATLGGNDDYYVIGGTAAVNATVMNQLNASKLGTVTRLGGDTRYETGLAVADEFFTNARNVVIASGDDFPDGLTGGVLANAMNAPLMLVNQYNTDIAADYVDDNSVRTVIAIGGTTVIPDATLNKVA